MEPKIVEMDAMTVIGMESVGKHEQGEIPALWETFNPRRDEIAHKREPLVALGVCGEMRADGSFSYVAGYPVDRVEDVPAGMVVKEIPPATYAVFTHHGPLFGVEHDLSATYCAIYQQWLPRSGYTHAGTPSFEWYDERFIFGDARSEMDIYVPIKR
jgi:AraC family transcriptional regulator